MDIRTEAMVNGALVALGAVAVIDIVIFHWVLEWREVVDWLNRPELLFLEIIVVLLGVFLFAIGLWREAQAQARERPGAL